MTCAEARQALGGYVLGALSVQEQEDVRRHLTDCAACADEHRDLAAMPGFLALLSRGEAEQLAVPASPALLDRLLAAVVVERGAARRRRLVGIVAALVLVAGVGATGGLLLAGDGQPPPTPSAPAPDVRRVTATDSSGQVRADLGLRQVAWGTALDLKVRGVPGGRTCALVAVSKAGGRQTAATWAVPSSGPGAPPKELTIGGATALKPAQVDAFEVVTGDGTRLVRVRL